MKLKIVFLFVVVSVATIAAPSHNLTPVHLWPSDLPLPKVEDPPLPPIPKIEDPPLPLPDPGHPETAASRKADVEWVRDFFSWLFDDIAL